MRFLGLLVVVLAVVLGLGLYLGWFHVEHSSTGDTSKLTVTVDKDNVRKDETTAQDEAKHLGQEVKDAATAPGHK